LGVVSGVVFAALGRNDHSSDFGSQRQSSRSNLSSIKAELVSSIEINWDIVFSLNVLIINLKSSQFVPNDWNWSWWGSLAVVKANFPWPSSSLTRLSNNTAVVCEIALVDFSSGLWGSRWDRHRGNLGWSGGLVARLNADFKRRASARCSLETSIVGKFAGIHWCHRWAWHRSRGSCWGHQVLAGNKNLAVFHAGIVVFTTTKGNLSADSLRLDAKVVVAIIGPEDTMALELVPCGVSISSALSTLGTILVNDGHAAPPAELVCKALGASSLSGAGVGVGFNVGLNGNLDWSPHELVLVEMASCQRLALPECPIEEASWFRISEVFRGLAVGLTAGKGQVADFRGRTIKRVDHDKRVTRVDAAQRRLHYMDRQNNVGRTPSEGNVTPHAGSSEASNDTGFKEVEVPFPSLVVLSDLETSPNTLQIGRSAVVGFAAVKAVWKGKTRLGGTDKLAGGVQSIGLVAVVPLLAKLLTLLEDSPVGWGLDTLEVGCVADKLLIGLRGCRSLALLWTEKVGGASCSTWRDRVAFLGGGVALENLSGAAGSWGWSRFGGVAVLFTNFQRGTLTRPGWYASPVLWVGLVALVQGWWRRGWGCAWNDGTAVLGACVIWQTRSCVC
jgi:hypothetical protein